MGTKTQEEKEFFISARKEIGPGLTNAPTWIMQKAAKRIWNKKGKRHWRQTHLKKLFLKKQKQQGKMRGKRAGSGKKHKSRILKNKKGRKW